MKVIRVVSELDFGGVEKVVALAVPELAKVQHLKVKVVVLGRGGRISDKLQQHGYEVLVLNRNTRIPNLFLVLRLKQIFDVEQPDVVHCQGSEANFHGIWAGKLSGVKIKVGEEIGFPNHHSYWKLIFKWVYKKADAVIAISDAVGQKIIKMGEVSPKKVKVIYNPSAINPLDNTIERGTVLPEIFADQNSFVFVTTCRLVPIKNLERLLSCFSELVKANPKKEFSLWLIGNGGEKDRLIQLASQLSISNQVRFFGFRESVHEFLRAADVFILPSLSEGSSVSLAEAMMAGLPSIVTEVGGAKEILGKSRSGMLVNPLSNDSILAAMQSIFDLSAEERKAMGLRAKNESKRFLVETHVRELLKVYQF